MTTENDNQGESPRINQSETGALDVEGLASLLDSSVLSSSPQTDAAESENKTAEDQGY